MTTRAASVLQSLSTFSRKDEVFLGRKGPLPQDVIDPETGEPLRYQDPLAHSAYPLTAYQRKKIEQTYQKELVRDFQDMNPHVLQRLRTALNDGDWGKLTWMLSKGAFWAAAAFAIHLHFGPLWYANPLLYAGTAKALYAHKDRQDVKRVMGIKRGRWIQFINRSYQGTKKAQEKEASKLRKIPDKRPQLVSAVRQRDPYYDMYY